MILGKINQPERGLFALIAAPEEYPGLAQQIMAMILQQLGPNLDQALLNLCSHPQIDVEQHLDNIFSAAMQRVVDYTGALGADGLSFSIGKAKIFGEGKFRMLLANSGDHHIYFQDSDGTFLHAKDQVPNIINATLTPGSRLILATPAIREHLLPRDLARLITHNPHSDATAEQIVLRSLAEQAGDKEILIWTARELVASVEKPAWETAPELPASVRLARLNNRLQVVFDQLAAPQPALERLQLEMAKANLEYWLAHSVRQSLSAKSSPILAPGDLVYLPDAPSEEYVVHAYNPEDESYLIRQSRRHGRRQDLRVKDLAVDRFALESWQTSRLTQAEQYLLKRALQALEQMKRSHREYHEKKRTYDLFVRQAQDLAWENRRHAMRQKVRDIY